MRNLDDDKLKSEEKKPYRDPTDLAGQLALVMAFLRPKQGSHEVSIAPAILAKAPVVLLPVTSPAHTHNTTFQDMHALTLACIGANGPFGSPLCHLDSRQELQSQPSCAPQPVSLLST